MFECTKCADIAFASALALMKSRSLPLQWSRFLIRRQGRSGIVFGGLWR